MSRPPSQKGTSVLPVVTSLRQNPGAKQLLPPSVWKYLDEPVLVSGWYPERDYWILIEALVKTLDPTALGGDVWRYFARFSAQRDIGGQGAAGVYRNFASVDATDLASFFGRATRLWSQYHDTGRMEIVGGRAADLAVVMRLVGFVIPIEGFVRLQGYYLEEYGKLVGVGLTSSVAKSTAAGDPFCEWVHRLDRTPASEAYVGSLPASAG